MKSTKQFFSLSFVFLLQVSFLSASDKANHKKDKMTIKDKAYCCLGITGFSGMIAAISKTGITPFASVTGGYLGSLFVCLLLDKDENTVDFSNKYPYVQQWYNVINQKYPKVQFKSYRLRETLSSRSDFCAANNSIFILSEVLEKINKVYEKKVNQEKLLLEEEDFLTNAEWPLRHESAHLKHKDPLFRIYFGLAACAGIESSYQFAKYKKVIPAACSKNIITKGATALTASAFMFYAHGVLTHIYARYQESRADAFANKLADIESLRAARKNWLADVKNDRSLINREHPFAKDRALCVEREIKRRGYDV